MGWQASIRNRVRAIFAVPGLRHHLCWRGSPKRSHVALTFDDGPDPDYTPDILNVLQRHGVRASFFLLGEQIEKHPELVRRIARDGHAIGNHGYDHKAEDIVGQIMRCNERLAGLGIRTPLVRPPAGRLTVRALLRYRREGYSVVLWSFDAHDSMRHEGKWSQPVNYETIAAGDIVLMHDDNPLCVAELPQLLTCLHEKRLSPVTIPELVAG